MLIQVRLLCIADPFIYGEIKQFITNAGLNSVKLVTFLKVIIKLPCLNAAQRNSTDAAAAIIKHICSIRPERPWTYYTEVTILLSC